MHVNESTRVLASHLAEGDDPPIAVIPVAVPYFFVRFTAVCIARRALGILSEFALRALQLGYNQTRDLSSFLGVSDDEMKRELTALASEFFVGVSADGNSHVLLEKGLLAISEAGLTMPVVRESACSVHGSTRKVELVPGDLFPKRRLATYGMLMLPAIPVRPPRVKELDVSDVKLSLMHTRNSLPRVMEVSRLGRIVRTNSLFKMGYLLLRKGANGVPQDCVEGSVNLDLAQRYAQHPAIQQLRTILEKQQTSSRRTIIQHCAMLGTATAISSADIRDAVAKLVAFAGSVGVPSSIAVQLLLKATDSLVKRPAWVGVQEAQALFSRAVLAASSQLVVAVPTGNSVLLDQNTLENLSLALARRIKVVLHIAHDDDRFDPRGKLSDLTAAGAKLVRMHAGGEWTGFTCDDAFGVVGKASECACSMGRFQSFFGAVVLRGQQPTRLLEELATRSSAPVQVKARRVKIPTK